MRNDRDFRRALLEHQLRTGLTRRRFGTALAGYGLRFPSSPGLYEAAASKGAEMLTKPSIARVYDFWLGGSSWLPADMEMAEELEMRFPGSRDAARTNRAFAIRAAEYCAARGITRFIDLGAGLPTPPNIHEAVRRYQPEARVVYVDSDLEVLVQSRHLLGVEGVVPVAADLRDPESVFAHPDLRAMLGDGDEPVCVLLTSVLHFLTPADARDACKAIVDLIPPGSYVVISVGVDPHGVAGDYSAAYGEESLVHGHTVAHIAGYFDGLDLTSSGLVDVRRWGQEDTVAVDGPAVMMAGVGRKP